MSNTNIKISKKVFNDVYLPYLDTACPISPRPVIVTESSETVKFEEYPYNPFSVNAFAYTGYGCSLSFSGEKDCLSKSPPALIVNK